MAGSVSLLSEARLKKKKRRIDRKRWRVPSKLLRGASAIAEQRRELWTLDLRSMQAPRRNRWSQEMQKLV